MFFRLPARSKTIPEGLAYKRGEKRRGARISLSKKTSEQTGGRKKPGPGTGDRRVGKGGHLVDAQSMGTREKTGKEPSTKMKHKKPFFARALQARLLIGG